MKTSSLSSRSRQQGASLIVVLILLLVMTLLGLAVLRSTLLEERMTANLQDRSWSFQAAEAALRDGEALAATRPAVPAAGCAAGVCSTPVATDAERWRTAGFNGWVNGSDQGTRTARPQYFIEYMGDVPTWPGCDLLDEANRSPLCLAPRYRITSNSSAADRAQVVLQSNFLVQ